MFFIVKVLLLFYYNIKRSSFLGEPVDCFFCLLVSLGSDADKLELWVKPSFVYHTSNNPRVVVAKQGVPSTMFDLINIGNIGFV